MTETLSNTGDGFIYGKKERRFGLVPLSCEDIEANRPYTVGALYRIKGAIPHKRTLPLNIPNEWVFNQGWTDLCAGCSSANASAVQEYLRIDPTFVWMLARQRAGMRVDQFGVNNRDMAMAHVKAGALPYGESPYTMEQRDIVADPTKWDIAGLLKRSVYHKKGGAVWVANYDEARQAIERLDALYEKPHSVVFGLVWDYDMSARVLEDVKEKGEPHDVLMIDWDQDYAIILNSYGLSAGEMGRHRMHRRIFDRYAEMFGAFILVDETPEKLKWAIENGVKLDTNWLVNIYIAIANAIKDLLAEIKKKTVGAPPPYPEKIKALFLAMRRKEGWAVGTRAWRNNSPHNSRYVGQYKAIGEDREGVPDGQNGYAIFPDYKTGEEYCLKVIYDHCTGRSIAYNMRAQALGLTSSAELSLYQYFAIFAPSKDNNNPKKYAEDVAEWLGVSPETQLKEFVK